jgi:hypothetical protein
VNPESIVSKVTTIRHHLYCEGSTGETDFRHMAQILTRLYNYFRTNEFVVSITRIIFSHAQVFFLGAGLPHLNSYNLP